MAIAHDDVLQAIQDAGGENLSDVDLLDYFEDDAMQKRGQKSLAFHLIFQAEIELSPTTTLKKISRRL